LVLSFRGAEGLKESPTYSTYDGSTSDVGDTRHPDVAKACGELGTAPLPYGFCCVWVNTEIGNFSGPECTVRASENKNDTRKKGGSDLGEMKRPRR
jgi:hypothetical protein